MRRLLTTVLAAAALLVVPASASAAFTSARTGTTVTITGTNNAESLTISTTGLVITHDQVGGGFNSPQDWDTDLIGDQTVPADDTYTLVLSTAGGDDVVSIGSAGFLSTTIAGGDGNDALDGSPDADAIDGGAGDDVIAGNQGADALVGGAGDDEFVWRNGDGSDTVDGGDGEDESRVNGAAVAEIFTVTLVDGRVRVDRTSPGAFSVSHATIEHVALRTYGGNDTITGAIGLAGATELTLDAGRGNDTVTGGNGDDLILGGAGADTINGGAGADVVLGGTGADAITGGDGSDVLSGDSGDDTVTAKDSTTDDVRCGTGTDIVSADTADRLDDCETITRADHSAVVTATTITASRTTNGYTAKVRVSCLSDRACVGNVGLTTRRGIVTSSGVRTVVLFAKVKLNIEAGAAKDVTVNLSRYAWRLGTRIGITSRYTIPVQAAVEIKDDRFVRRTFHNFALELPAL
jgi:hypothetical protein